MNSRLTRQIEQLLNESRRLKDARAAHDFLANRVQVTSHYMFDHWRDGHLIDQFGFQNLVVTEGLNTLLGRTFDVVGSDVLWYVGLIGAGTGTVAVTSGAAAVTGTSTDFQAADVGADIIIVGAGAAGADFIGTIATRTSTTAITISANAGTTVTGAGYAVEPRPADVMATKSFNEVAPYSNANRPTWTKNGAPSAGAMSNSSSPAAFTINATSRIYGAFMSNNNTKSGTTGVLYGGGLFITQGSRPVLSGDTLNGRVDLSVTAA